jgi:hypothetical protein
VLVIVTLLVVGCRPAPKAELGAYRAASAAARELGESMLVDHRAALAEFRAIKPGAAPDFSDALGLVHDVDARNQLDGLLARLADQEGEAQAGAMAYIDSLTLDTATMFGEVKGVGAVASRLRAWEVIGRYNDALATLAEGKSVDEARTKTAGLIESLKSLPEQFKSVANLAGDIAPFARPIAEVVALMEQAVLQHRFREAVANATPVVRDYITQVLVPDAQNMYNVRLGLHVVAYQEHMALVTDEAAAAGGAAARLPGADTPDGFSAASLYVDRLNAAMKRLPTYRDEFALDLKPEANGATPENEMEARIKRVESAATDAVAEVEKFRAYRDATEKYARALGEMDVAMEKLHTATTTQRPQLPDAERVLNLMTEARAAMETYKALRN